MENDQAKRIIDKIKHDHIVPESRFKLHWKSYVFWVLWLAMVLLGALFFSFIILNMLDLDGSLLRYLEVRRLFFVMMVTAPYLWIGLAVMALVTGFLALRKTKRGYRYSMLFATSLGVLVISLVGILFHLAKINQRVGQGIPPGLPGYHQLAFPIEDRWMRPEEGMLAGEVRQVEGQQLKILSFDNDEWLVKYSDQTLIRVHDSLEPGLHVGVIGEKTGEKFFQAKFIRELPPGGGKGKMKPMECDGPPCSPMGRHRDMMGQPEPE